MCCENWRVKAEGGKKFKFFMLHFEAICSRLNSIFSRASRSFLRAQVKSKSKLSVGQANFHFVRARHFQLHQLAPAVNEKNRKRSIIGNMLRRARAIVATKNLQTARNQFDVPHENDTCLRHAQASTLPQLMKP